MTSNLAALVRGPRRRALLTVVATFALALVPSAAYAHGLDDVSDRRIRDFVPIGIEHMLLGWDHLLFIAGVLLIADGWKRAAKLITVFVLGHSLTLIVATIAGWQVNATFVDVVIGLSVVYVGVVALRPGRPRWRVFAAVIFGFGLIHGLGLSTRLQALGLHEDGLIARVIAFNVGIEIGQLTAIGVICGLVVAGRWLWRTRDRDQPLVVHVGAGVLVAGGLLAATLVVYGALTADPAEATTDPAPAAGAADGPCVQGPRTQQFPSGGGHVDRVFWEPNEASPMGDFGHWLADGYLVYLYRPDLPEADLDRLRDAVDGAIGSAVLAGPSPEQDAAVVAVTASTQLTCEQVEIDALTDFTTSWVQTGGR